MNYCVENVELGGWMISTIYVSFTKKPTQL